MKYEFLNSGFRSIRFQVICWCHNLKFLLVLGWVDLQIDFRNNSKSCGTAVRNWPRPRWRFRIKEKSLGDRQRKVRVAVAVQLSGRMLITSAVKDFVYKEKSFGDRQRKVRVAPDNKRRKWTMIWLGPTQLVPFWSCPYFHRNEAFEPHLIPLPLEIGVLKRMGATSGG